MKSLLNIVLVYTLSIINLLTNESKLIIIVCVEHCVTPYQSPIPEHIYEPASGNLFNWASATTSPDHLRYFRLKRNTKIWMQKYDRYAAVGTKKKWWHIQKPKTYKRIFKLQSFHKRKQWSLVVHNYRNYCELYVITKHPKRKGKAMKTSSKLI